MFHSLHSQSPGERQAFCAVTGPSPLDPETLDRHGPDALGLLPDGAARCSLWWRDVPACPGQRLGIIGHYAARDAMSARRLLDEACTHLAQQGCTLAVGPMDGNTWRRYRLVTERGDEPMFFLEPDNPDAYPQHFCDAGFDVFAEYYSALYPELPAEDPRSAELSERLAGQEIELRPLDPANFCEELRRIYLLSLASFRNNFLYSPIGEPEFLALYQGLQSILVPELVLLAEQRGRTVGFLFALPDLMQKQRGQTIDTIIIKTVAVHPDVARHGLGGLLGARCHEAAHRLGFRRAIHALMHQSNQSRRISDHYARTIRRYALFGRELGLS